jgi:hypothetical protein
VATSSTDAVETHAPTVCTIPLKVMANKVTLKKLIPFAIHFLVDGVIKTAEVNAKTTAQKYKNRCIGKQPLRFHW